MIRVDMRGRLESFEVDMSRDQLLDKLNLASHNGNEFIAVPKSDGRMIAMSVSNVLTFEETDETPLTDMIGGY